MRLREIKKDKLYLVYPINKSRGPYIAKVRYNPGYYKEGAGLYNLKPYYYCYAPIPDGPYKGLPFKVIITSGRQVKEVEYYEKDLRNI